MTLPEIPSNILGSMLAALGGAAAYIHRWLHGEEFVIYRLIAETFIGGFVGTLSWYLAVSLFDATSPIIVFITGASGAVGYKAIEPMWNKILFGKRDI